MRRSATALFAALVGIAALSACGSSGSTAGTGSTKFTVTFAPTSRPATTASSTPATSSPSTTAAGADGACVGAHLQAILGESGAAAGNRYQTVILTNKGDAECTLKGYPGVSLLDGSGARIGQPAARETADVAEVSLAAQGGQASFFIHTSADLSGMGCQPPSATIAVIAPNDTASLSVAGEITVCGSFSVGPVVAGTTGHG